MPSRDEIKEFSMMVEKLATDEHLTLMDAICHHCKESGLEIEVAATMISSALKAKIREEAQELNLLKKSSKLPI
jgi:thymidine kinase